MNIHLLQPEELEINLLVIELNSSIPNFGKRLVKLYHIIYRTQ